MTNIADIDLADFEKDPRAYHAAVTNQALRDALNRIKELEGSEPLYQKSIRDLLGLIEWFMGHHEGLPPMQYTSIVLRARDLSGSDED